MKRKLFLLLCTLLSMLGVQAQTDVTSTYLTNADFESSATYDKSSSATVTTNQQSTFQIGDGWTQTSKGDWAMGVSVAYGSNATLNSVKAPSKNPSGNDGVAVFFSAGHGNEVLFKQNDNVTLNPGTYTLRYKGYNQNNGHNNILIRFGFVASDNSITPSSTNEAFAYQTWVEKSITITVNSATEGYFQIGAQGVSGAGGSGNNAKIFIDGLTLEYTDFKAELRAVITQAQAINARISTLSDDITTAQEVLNTTSASKTTIDGSVTTLRSAIETKLAAYTGLNAAGDDITSFIANNGFETSPIFDGTSLGSNTDPKSNATPTDGSTLLYNAKNVYQINGWELLTTETSDFARTFTMPYNTTLYVNSNNAVAGQAVAAPANGSSVTADNNSLLFVEANWCENAVLGVKQTIPLPAGSYRFTFDSYVTNAIGNADSRCGVSYSETTDYKWPAALNTWTTNEIDFTLDAQTDVTISMGYKKIGNVGGGSSAFLFVDNVKLTYYNPLALAKIQWAEAKDVAENFDQSVKMSAVTLAALNDAIDTYATDAIASSEDIEEVNAAKDALTTAVDNANASKDVYATLNTAITTVEGWTATTAAAGLRTKYNNGTYDDETTVNDIYAEYRTAEIAALTSADADDWTSVIFDHSFESGGMTFWSAESRSDTGVKDQSNGTYSITSGDPVDGSKLFNSWGGTAENDVKQTIKGLPAGTYTLTALVAGFNGEELTLAANTTTNSVTVEGDKTVGYTVDVKFTLAEAGDVVIKASNTKSNNGSDASFIKADNFRLYKGDVMTDDYTALNTAIADAETYTLGFENAEYAPYNNVAALTALANAKAVNQEKKTAQPLLDDIVSNLTSATWTPNDADVDAVFNGNFELGAWPPTAWVCDAWAPQVNNINEKSQIAETNYGLRSNPGWTHYGTSGVYTMPLKGQTIYLLKFKYGNWDQNTTPTVSVLKDTEGMAAMTFEQCTTNYQDGMISKEVLFVTGSEGNYALNIHGSNNIVLTDVSIKKAASQTLTLADDAAMPAFAPGTYPSVRVNRTLNTGENVWNTLVLPFDYTNADWAVRELSSSTEDNLSFSVVEGGAMTAGKPYLVRPNAAVTYIEAENVAVITTPAAVETEKYSFIPVFAPATITGDGTNYFVATGTNKLYCAKANIATNGYRAYFHYTGENSGARSVFLNFDETDPTAINAIEAAETESGALKDGKYIIDNKVVIVKNGVKYSANGQKLN